jgi:hypothetical protein
LLEVVAVTVAVSLDRHCDCSHFGLWLRRDTAPTTTNKTNCDCSKFRVFQTQNHFPPSSSLTQKIFKATGKKRGSTYMEADTFLVREARQIAFNRLPERVRKQFAFQHFYTESLDGSSGHLSVKFLAMFISYFCAIFKLEGRRKQYEERPSDKSGRDFARAHKKAQIVFQQLSATYSVVITRYSRHHILEVRPPRGSSSAVVGSPSGISGIAARAHVIREPAFRYESDELVFFELLYQVTADVVRMAFEGDATVQELAVEEANRLFRSKSFLFEDQRRSNDVGLVAHQLDAKAHSVLENTQQLAELLVPRGAKLMVKYASIQRSPFLACQLPGGTSHLKYQRVKKPGAVSAPTPAEKLYKVEMTTCCFPSEHRAMTEASHSANPVTGDGGSAGLGGGGRQSPTNRSDPSSSFNQSRSNVTPLPPSLNPMDLAAPSPDLEQGKAKNLASAMARKLRLSKPRPLSPEIPEAQDGPEDDDGDANGADLERYYSRPAAAWYNVDVMQELTSIYQALANGVVVSHLTVPLDLKLQYDANGFLVPDSLPQV